MVAFTDDLTDITDIYLLFKKSRVLASLKKYAAIRKVEGCSMQKFLSDNGRKFDSHRAKIFIDAEEI